MKRFVDLRGQIYNDDDLPEDEQEPVFAFFCTSRDMFHNFNGDQTWDSIADFQESYGCDRKPETQGMELYDRLFNLIPSWVPEK